MHLIMILFIIRIPQLKFFRFITLYYSINIIIEFIYHFISNVLNFIVKTINVFPYISFKKIIYC
jgi:hypothetical protein